MRRSLRRSCQAAAISACALLGAGCASVGSAAGPQTSPTSKFITTPGEQNPTAGYTPTPQASGTSGDPGGSPFASLTSYIATRPGEVTAAVYDRSTHRTWVFHAGVEEDTASIVKVEIMGTLLKQAQTAGSPLPGTDLSLMMTMIENSDNSSATQLLSIDGGPSAVQSFDESVGMTHTTVSTQEFIPGSTTLPGWGLTKTTAADEVKLVRDFAYPNPILDSVNRKYGLGLMENIESDQAWGVSGGVPAGTTIALKNGWLPLDLASNTNWQVNSIGWIHGHGRDYVLAVLTDGSASEQTGIDTIAHISSVIYSELGH
jgi:hypothetical protein